MNLPEPIAARYQPWVRHWWLAVWSFAVLTMGVFFYFGLVMASVLLTGTGLLLTLFCLLVLFLVWRRLRTDEDVVIVDQAGYRDIRIGRLVPWSEIVQLVRHQPGTSVILFIETRQPERFLKPRYRFWNGAARLDRTLGFPALASSLAGLDRSADDIVSAAESWRAVARP